MEKNNSYCKYEAYQLINVVESQIDYNLRD